MLNFSLSVLVHRTFLVTIVLAPLSFLVSSCGDFSNNHQVNNHRLDPFGKPADRIELGLVSGTSDASLFCGKEPPKVALDIMKEHRFDASFINTKLSTAGLKGWVHGAVPQYKHYVMTYRKEDPSDFMAFFKAQQFSMIPANSRVAGLLPTLKRHDELLIKGKIFENGSPLVHILVDDINVIKKFPSPTVNYYTFDTSVFKDKKTANVFAMLHAATYSDELGWGLVIETDGMLLPVAVDPAHNDLVKNLYRGDILFLDLKIISHGSGTYHFVTDGQVVNPLTVVDSIINCHGLEREVSGTLVKFDKSPAISLDVYAVRYVDANGMARNFTFFPDADLDEEEFTNVFLSISQKAKKAWEAASQAPKDIRNFREKSAIKVKARGVLNVVSTEQANAQVYIKSADQVDFVVESN